ncbi:dihydrofolate reductase family protein [Alpinimonas psychrophila]|uniref:Dihydrofolate reductase n=1 Tax=Alpinimonas psychrophila TaxID=748908 RepID=A0A7W3JS59_9MICO|nr:dihydrofolate reductase family protein [Alpinimonas psychrophila]MBA8828147.1 dihydrofolate reductase [Alpinimonas psychrophila]
MSHRPRISVFIATSLDGLIATTDNSLEWLESAVGEGEDYGYTAFMAGIDSLAMGRGTYNFIAPMDPLPFGKRPLFVFTRDTEISREGVKFTTMTPTEAVEDWTRRELKHVYLDGGKLISSFVKLDLVDDMTITRVPVILGTGLPLFQQGFGPLAFTLDTSNAWPSGVISQKYSRIR